MDSMTTSYRARALRLLLSAFTTVPMRIIHGFCRVFPARAFAWPGSIPPMPTVREERLPTNDRITWRSVGSVAMAILVRLRIGHPCDGRPPRKTYSALLNVGAHPVMKFGPARDIQNFFTFRILMSQFDCFRTPAISAFTPRETTATVPSRIIPVTP
jgi:NNP family nitrate/nitrite transporter-like MFS transporter